jgi:regulatory protein
VDSPSPPPDAAALREAALAHLARYATTEARLRQVLDRRLDRWARSVAATMEPDAVAAALAAARPAVGAVVAALAAAGALDDAGFAAARARSLSRAGRSRRAIAAHLAARGVPAEAARDALPDDPAVELAAALLHARRRRLGPFRAAPLPPDDPTAARREQGVLARAGFSESVARQALGCERAEAEALIARARDVP